MTTPVIIMAELPQMLRGLAEVLFLSFTVSFFAFHNVNMYINFPKWFHFVFKKSVFCSIYIIITVTSIQSAGSRQVDRRRSPDQTRRGFSDQVTYYIPLPTVWKKISGSTVQRSFTKKIRA